MNRLQHIQIELSDKIREGLMSRKPVSEFDVALAEVRDAILLASYEGDSEEKARESAENLANFVNRKVTEHAYKMLNSDEVKTGVVKTFITAYADTLSSLVKKSADSISSLSDAFQNDEVKEMITQNKRRHYYIVFNGGERVATWPGAGRFTEEFQSVFRTKELTEMTKSDRPKNVMDQKGTIEGHLDDDTKFKIYTNDEFIKAFGVDGARKVAALNRLV